jgi:tRNA threonylcarbamoyladenosine biosynthesis protein TsaB
MKVVLHIDTSNNQEVVVGLTIDGKEDMRKQTPNHRKSQVVLPMIESIMKDHDITLKDLTEIRVNPGPGSFTGLRVGITIANTLAQLLDIPINGKKGEPVEAIYS